jgi:hypothetical protein
MHGLTHAENIISARREALVDEPFAAVWSYPTSELLRRLRTEAKGLTAEETKRRLARYGPNLFKASRRTDALALLISQFKSAIILVLLFAAGWRGGKWNGGEWPGKLAVGSTLIFSHPLSNMETVWVVASRLQFDEDAWVRRYQIAPHPISIRTTLFATHKTEGHGMYVEALIPKNGGNGWMVEA